MSEIAVYSTGHVIADTVGTAMAAGMDCHHIESSSPFPFADVHIGYGILRKTGEVFKECQKTGAPWFEVDRGYWKPGHYDGYYRISLRGTQHTGAVQDWMLDDTRWRALGVEVKPWRGFDWRKSILICPPTDYFNQFFYCRYWLLREEALLKIAAVDHKISYVIREKGNPNPINFSDYNYVLTFNSSVGWQALAAGIPCVSDPVHSLVGSHFKNFSLDILADAQQHERHKLFAAMSNLQLTLDEMKQGMLWPLMKRLLEIQK